MPENRPLQPDVSDDEIAPKAWDAAEVMSDRAAKSRDERDRSIADLRASTTDEQILDEFGIDLGEVER